MSDYWEQPLRDRAAPEVDGVTPLQGGDSETSQGVFDLIDGTRPDAIAQAGGNYTHIAKMCRESVEKLSVQAQAIANTLGGESMRGVFETIGELQADLVRIHVAASSVGQPLEWYGGVVLPWFKRNVPRSGTTSIDDDVVDSFGGIEDNAHVIARHHLRLLNSFMRDAYGAVTGYVEQSARTPQVGMTDPGLGSQTGLPLGMGGTPDPYAGSGLTSPYQNADFGGLTGPQPGLDTPGYQSPDFQAPGAQTPDLGQNPGGTDPSLQTPQPPTGQTTPDLKVPETQNAALNTPGLNTPNLTQPPSTTDLSGLNPAGLPNQPSGPNTGLPTGTATGPGLPSGSAAATQLGGAAGLPGGARAAASGMPMGMMPPMMGAGQGGQEKDRERARFPLVEDESFETDDMGGPSVIA